MDAMSVKGIGNIQQAVVVSAESWTKLTYKGQSGKGRRCRRRRRRHMLSSPPGRARSGRSLFQSFVAQYHASTPFLWVPSSANEPQKS